VSPPQTGIGRREFLGGAAALASTLASGRPAWAAQGAEGELAALVDRLWDEHLQRFPETATVYGIDTGPRAGLRARLDPWSREARTEWVDWAAGNVGRLGRIDPAALSQTSRINRAVLLDFYGKIARLGARYPFGEAASGNAPVAPYAISQLSGPYRVIPDMLESRHPIATREDCQAWLARLEAFTAVLDASTTDLRADVAAGIAAPRFALDAALAQLTALRAPEPRANGLAAGLGRKAAAAGIAGDWLAQATKIVVETTYPALDRQIAAVSAARDRSTDHAGVWKLPDGRAFYADALAYHTSSALTPAEVHRLGLEQVAQISAEMDRLLAGMGLSRGTVAERVATLGKRPGEAYPDNDNGREQVLAEFGAAIGRIRPRLPEIFGVLPSAALEIRRVPPAIQQGAALAYAQGGSLDGTRPGVFYVNLQNVAEWPRFAVATTAFHEGIPGHLWEGATASANPDIPAVRKRGTRYAAYAEGWALYVEQVVDELGYYADDPASRIGYLQMQLFRAARLVVDTGVHDLMWSRDKAVDYLVALTGQAPSSMRREVERYCVTPGQACAYKVGQIEWLRLRSLAQRLGGARFDIRKFHEVIRFGRAPFGVVEEVVTAMFA
jgi:uncharacterized protein (DUF885 family)